ncbi:MAG TPA: ATP-binding protein [Gemmatimonadales bacterium]|nr:ATP-binding protein [Gemmatimonadales bacterium]
MTSPLRLVVRRSSDLELPVEVSTRIPSDLDVVHESVEILARHAFAGIPSTPECERYRNRLKTLLCEALANAIVHGHREDPTKFVHVRIEVEQTLVHVHVTDEGPGCDHTHTPVPLDPADLDRETGRGLLMIQNLADSVSFNPQGNSICMTLRRP